MSYWLELLEWSSREIRERPRVDDSLERARPGADPIRENLGTWGPGSPAFYRRGNGHRTPGRSLVSSQRPGRVQLQARSLRLQGSDGRATPGRAGARHPQTPPGPRGVSPAQEDGSVWFYVGSPSAAVRSQHAVCWCLMAFAVSAPPELGGTRRWQAGGSGWGGHVPGVG